MHDQPHHERPGHDLAIVPSAQPPSSRSSPTCGKHLASQGCFVPGGRQDTYQVAWRSCGGIFVSETRSPGPLHPRRWLLARQPALLYHQQELSAVLHSWTPSLEAATAPQAPLHPVLLTHSQTSNKLDWVVSLDCEAEKLFPDSPGASEDPWPLGATEFILAMTSCTRSWTEALRNMTFRKATLHRNPHVKRKKDANNRPISSHTTRTPWRAPPSTQPRARSGPLERAEARCPSWRETVWLGAGTHGATEAA